MHPLTLINASLPPLAGEGQEGGESSVPPPQPSPAVAGEGERSRLRTAQSFCVPKSDIAATGYDLSLNRYKKVVHEEVQHDPPKKILAELRKIEEEIEKGMEELEGKLG